MFLKSVDVIIAGYPILERDISVVERQQALRDFSLNVCL